MLYNLYRISDAGREKEKITGATKINCLKNFISVFGTEGLFVFADNCSEGTIKQIKELGIEPVLINLGNAGSFRHIVDFALAKFNDNDQVYLVEDDYWHLPASKQALLEGLEIADYVTLYDHSDKYVSFSKKGGNPYVTNNSEKSRVFLSHTCHWKISNSTSMTFATRLSVLKADKEVMWRFTQQNIPEDFGMFLILTRQSPFPLYKAKVFRHLFKLSLKYLFNATLKKRVLITALPGLSTHIENAYLSPHTDWEIIIQKFDENQPK
ncbi:hypothetical protein SAMN05421821_11131 [Mucilaginibacter lappiensis]|uniref:Glycosyl transferase family 2 n=1 Tax=Mucilaginibacter lappiensis TaxID=354630 RepID=A0ABR6PN75_9SPHI|nr:hypothetical protein [Mucilaginibacter lappiensis]MBB6111221.1 hypothetical protein [Mucilaginibacter lappiensis]SIR73271.1 hypothetical protein SAMN05421821_11131 [Mucilaginibacter lappiensis]